jgi:hypothetical protein
MMIRIALMAAASTLCLAAAQPAGAQRVPIDSIAVADTTLRHMLRLRDGSQLLGRIVSVTADSVRMQMPSGEVAVTRSAIADVRQFPASRLRDGKYWADNPNATRLLFAPTALPLERGEGYYWNAWLLLHGAAYGVSNRFTIGGGLTLIPGINIGDNVFFLTPKYTVINAPRAGFAVGALMGYLPVLADEFDADDKASWGIVYGIGSVGSGDNNLSLGLGWGYVGGDFANRPVAMLGGQTRVSRRLSFISENWFVSGADESAGLLSYGLRFLGERMSVDLAFLTTTEGGVFPGVPWVGFAIKF